MNLSKLFVGYLKIICKFLIKYKLLLMLIIFSYTIKSKQEIMQTLHVCYFFELFTNKFINN